MARVLVELDPEYVPWDVPEERPKMQRRRRKVKVPKVALIVVPLLLLVACGVVGVLYGPQRHDQARAETPEATGSPPVAAEADTADGNPAVSAVELPGIGKPGALALQRDTAITFIPCLVYTVTTQSGIQTGSTVDGPVVDVTGESAIVECDGQTFDF